MVRPSLRTPAVGPDGLPAALSSGAVPHPKRLLACAMALALALVLGACGQSGSARPDAAATLELDFQPNAVHAGIYTALARDYTGAEGVDLSVRAPGASTDSVKLLSTGRAQFAILDIHDLALAREKGQDLVGVMAIVEGPLASVIVPKGIASPRDLEGRRVGVTGLPSDDAVLASIVQGAGGDPARVRKTTIGFDAVPALLSGKVSGATSFWNAEGVALNAKAYSRGPFRAFRVDQYGAPSYPELVLTVTRQTLQDSPSLVGATVRALQRGYREALVDPDSAVQELVDANPGLDRALMAKELDAVQPLFQADDGTVGTFDEPALRRWAAWERRFGIVRRTPDVAQAFSPGLARSGAAEAKQTSG
ncbi:MAG: putative hydroxymethylpyrimidine transport system substrate-binding protein [Solirubrobacteraceae bacterium]|jgi:putative hydroxymethylpyrimidine transport system substrate-binding protein|nr:putative hydroxymethylpyrimidine transport system substrate-binding protein [Solirubrobacteraceae bacterium]